MTVETERITLPKEVAEAIEILRGGIEPWNNYAIITSIDDEAFQDEYPQLITLYDYFNVSVVHSNRHPNALMVALVNGYQVE
jgi:hypothetical protein